MTAPGPDRATPDGIVLAGGPGRRMGHPKATVRLGDLTLVEHAVELLRPRCARVVVVTREEIALPPLAVDVIVDRPGPDCPLVALATGLAATGTRDVLVLACDLPFAAPLLDALLDAPPGRAVVGRSGAHIQPLCARYPRAEALSAAEGLLAAGRLPARGPALALEAHGVDDRWGALVNLNTPADLAHAVARAAHAVQAG